MAKFLDLHNSTHVNGYTMKVEQHRPGWSPDGIYVLAYKEVPKRESLERLDQGEKTTVTHTHHPFPHKTTVNAVNANSSAKQFPSPTTVEKQMANENAAKPTNTYVNAVGNNKNSTAKVSPNPPSASPVPKAAASKQPIWVPCCKHWKKQKHTEMDYRINWGAANGTIWVCKPNSLYNDSHRGIPQNNDWAVKGGKPNGGKPKGGWGNKGGNKMTQLRLRWEEFREAPPSREEILRHPYDTTVALIPSRIMKGPIVTGDKPNFPVGLLCLMENSKPSVGWWILGAKHSHWRTLKLWETKCPKSMSPPNGGAYYRQALRHLCRGWGG